MNVNNTGNINNNNASNANAVVPDSSRSSNPKRAKGVFMSG